MRKLFITSVFIFIIMNILHIYAQGEKKLIADSIIRLHVVAEDNSEREQEIKIAVRDEIIKKLGKEIGALDSKEKAVLFIQQRKNEIYKICRETLLSYNCIKSVSVSLEQCCFPTKTYGNFKLPRGRYDALNIKIGEAKGENWWCVMYPPLCFSQSQDGIMANDELKKLKESLKEDKFRLITDAEDKKIQIKFKLLEIF